MSTQGGGQKVRPGGSHRRDSNRGEQVISQLCGGHCRCCGFSVGGLRPNLGTATPAGREFAAAVDSRRYVDPGHRHGTLGLVGAHTSVVIRADDESDDDQSAGEQRVGPSEQRLWFGDRHDRAIRSGALPGHCRDANAPTITSAGRRYPTVAEYVSSGAAGVGVLCWTGASGVQDFLSPATGPLTYLGLGHGINVVWGAVGPDVYTVKAVLVGSPGAVVVKTEYSRGITHYSRMDQVPMDSLGAGWAAFHDHYSAVVGPTRYTLTAVAYDSQGKELGARVITTTDTFERSG